MKWLPMLIFATAITSTAHAQGSFQCPLGWDLFQDHCYHLVAFSPLTYEEADVACMRDTATLVSVNSLQELSFLNSLLTRFLNRGDLWYTSGTWRKDEEPDWTGDGSDVNSDLNFWIPGVTRTKEEFRIVLTFYQEGNGYRLSWARGADRRPYICEIALAEAYRVNRPTRDLTYGTEEQNPGLIERGPKFVTQPESVVMLGNQSNIYLECATLALPDPTYVWLRNIDTPNRTAVSTASDSRYTITNGRLTISYPDPLKDSGVYQCQASNKFGSILSDPATISAGRLKDFPNLKPGSVVAYQYLGTQINCNQPQYNPDVTFQWYKTDTAHFLRPSLNPHTFISRNGRLYFSETQLSDAGDYHCIVTLAAKPGQRLATRQPPMKTSLAIELEIKAENANDNPPEVHDDFPHVHPDPPISGGEVRIECFAYGRLPLYYQWSREGGLPAQARMEDLNRVLVLPRASLQDSGSYVCTVTGPTQGVSSKAVYLSIVSPPYFPFPLGDQLVDMGSQLTWRCDAMGNPPPSYTWYKDGAPLHPVPGDVEILTNVLVIRRLDNTRHSGMYQCRASNNYGTVFSSGELRVLSFQPSFTKHPLPPTMVGALRGNITIPCLPEAAPTPTVEWSKDGRSLGLTPSSTGQGRVVQLPQGSLVITGLTQGDVGLYTCKVNNANGQASSSTTLSVVDNTVLTAAPRSQRVEVNSSAVLECQASYDQRREDLVYAWKFNGRPLQIENSPHFRATTDVGHPTGLVISFAQREHQGNYECTATTTLDSVSASAYLTVIGPPYEPAGVFAHDVRPNEVDLRWSPSGDNGSPILYFTIEGATDVDPTWQLLRADIPIRETMLQDYPSMNGVTLTNLSAGVGYHFRVKAANLYGYSPFSVPSGLVVMHTTSPIVAPTDVGGGGGTVYVLTITWTPLQPMDYNGPGLRYIVRWRKKENNPGLWGTAEVSGDQSRYVQTLTMDDYYLPYEVKVQAVNNVGPGPNSTIAIVYSSEDMPPAQVQNVQAGELNSTAGLVTWTPVPDDRKHMKGRVLGYQVNYWYTGDTYMQARFVRYYGQHSRGLIIGLEPNTGYWVNMQVFNTAGLGPRSEDYNIAGTKHFAPRLYPEYVAVFSHGPDSVLVQWRGFSTASDEETLQGYIIRCWKATQDIRTATDVRRGKETWGVVHGIEKGVVYVVRVLGYSIGGEGNKSPPAYFTLGGQVMINSLYTDILAAAPRQGQATLALILTSALAAILLPLQLGKHW